MKLWLKIAIVFFVLSNLLIQTLSNFIDSKIKNEIITLHGEKLKSIAATASSTIDGDLYKQLNFINNPNLSKEDEYLKIRDILRNTKKILNFKEDIYTISLVDSNKAVFGVMTNQTSFSGDTLHLISPAAKSIVKEVYKTKKPAFTKFYKDQYGEWMSGLAPIKDSNGYVVGIVQVDHQASVITARLDEFNNEIFQFRLLLIPLIILLSVVLSKFISNPISKLTEVIEKIAAGDYTNGDKIKAGGEIKILVESIDRMRKTILLQQQKIFNTIKELKETNKNLIEAKKLTEAADKLKGEFLIIISHEIRTPLNAIQNYLYFIKEDLAGNDSEEITQSINAIDSESKRLIRTIDSIVTMAELETGSYKKVAQQVNLKELVKSQCKEFRSSAEARNNKIEFSFPDDETTIEADEYTVNLICMNLIDNAIKFTENGKISVSIFKNEFNNLCLQVQDTGIGMSEEFIPKLFNSFAQEDSGYSRKFEGNGIGLALVKRCCQLNNADIYVKSKKGYGSTFTVVFKDPVLQPGQENYSA